MKLTYHRSGDYLLPDLGLDERDKQPTDRQHNTTQERADEHQQRHKWDNAR